MYSLILNCVTFGLIVKICLREDDEFYSSDSDPNAVLCVRESKVMIICKDKCSDLNEILYETSPNSHLSQMGGGSKIFLYI